MSRHPHPHGGHGGSGDAPPQAPAIPVGLELNWDRIMQKHQDEEEGSPARGLKRSRTASSSAASESTGALSNSSSDSSSSGEMSTSSHKSDIKLGKSPARATPLEPTYALAKRAKVSSSSPGHSSFRPSHAHSRNRRSGSPVHPDASFSSALLSVSSSPSRGPEKFRHSWKEPGRRHTSSHWRGQRSDGNDDWRDHNDGRRHYVDKGGRALRDSGRRDCRVRDVRDVHRRFRQSSERNFRDERHSQPRGQGNRNRGGRDSRDGGGSFFGKNGRNHQLGDNYKDDFQKGPYGMSKNQHNRGYRSAPSQARSDSRRRVSSNDEIRRLTPRGSKSSRHRDDKSSIRQESATRTGRHNHKSTENVDVVKGLLKKIIQEVISSLGVVDQSLLCPMEETQFEEVVVENNVNAIDVIINGVVSSTTQDGETQKEVEIAEDLIEMNVSEDLLTGMCDEKCEDESEVRSPLIKEMSYLRNRQTKYLDGNTEDNARHILLQQGIPLAALDYEDGFAKMALTFAGRLFKVAHYSNEDCRRLSATMIRTWQVCNENYQSLWSRYKRAKMALKVPQSAMLDLREEMHKLLRSHVKRRKSFRFSELVDLTMYYFNHVASHNFS